MGNLAKDTTELDLWAFDDVEPAAEDTPAQPPPAAAPATPSPRDSGKKQQRPWPDSPLPPVSSEKSSIRVDVTKKLPKAQLAGPRTGQVQPGSDFDDLDQWDEPQADTVLGEISEEIPVAPVSAPPQPSVVVELPPAPAPAPPTPEPDLHDEFTPHAPENAVPISLRPHLRLSQVERIGLGTLLALLLIGGAVIFFNTIHRLPSGSQRLKANDFPVKGQHIVILAAYTYWRAPIFEGKNVETFRRGTQLLPVVKLTSSGAPASIRVFFRNSDGEVIGDAVTRTLTPGPPLEVAATAGFEDVGMHAAYRTGQSKPWTVQVDEAPAADSPSSDYKKLFEMNVSTDRR